MYANKAKHVQLETQRVALELISEWVNKTHIKNVCVVGGYGLNVVANQHYLKHMPNVNFYFEPVADDTGTPIGACMIKHKWLTGKTPTGLKHNFYHYYDADADKYLPSSETKTASVEEVCELLIQQKTVAIFDGAPEAGPRALGHRSILFDSRNPKAKELVNKVKRREWYRPFAGVVLKSEFNKYFETLGLEEAPFMTINFECKDITKRTSPGIVHADGSCRVQTVADGFLHELLSLFYEKTGCPLLLNTSFNLAGEALVQTKQDALNTFLNSKLDAVYFVNEKFLIVKED